MKKLLLFLLILYFIFSCSKTIEIKKEVEIVKQMDGYLIVKDCTKKEMYRLNTGDLFNDLKVGDIIILYLRHETFTQYFGLQDITIGGKEYLIYYYEVKEKTNE